MIEPIVGKIVWVRNSDGRIQPLAAIITSVFSSTEITAEITATIFELDCEKHMRLTLYQGDTRPSQGPFAEWAPYQKDQEKAETV